VAQLSHVTELGMINIEIANEIHAVHDHTPYDLFTPDRVSISVRRKLTDDRRPLQGPSRVPLFYEWRRRSRPFTPCRPGRHAPSRSWLSEDSPAVPDLGGLAEEFHRNHLNAPFVETIWQRIEDRSEIDEPH
jgi:hypothetical protein